MKVRKEMYTARDQLTTQSSIYQVNLLVKPQTITLCVYVCTCQKNHFRDSYPKTFH